ncbi:glycosyl hydrolase [Microbacterium sp. NPDC058345]|uniref:glycosyl hydrolase n=1 Tax=Microbacterium sp. NPDC058345 TaxID=3346455 RepID=UPI003665AD26
MALIGGGAVVAAPAATAATSPQTLVFGAVGGDFAPLDKAAGETVARHVYGNFQGSVPKGEMITVNAQNLSWRQISSVTSSSSLYQDIVRWADALKARGGTIELAFGHEPEASSKASRGTAEEYKQAYRKVVDIFNARGVNNVQWVLQMTDWSFRTSTTDRNYAGKWYPGDAYVDIIGADAYNWHTCGEGLGRDVPLSTVAGGVVTFAKAHGKKASLPEFAANKTVQRADWLREGYAWIKANKDVFVSAFYFNHPPTNPNNQDCSWPLSSSAEFTAFGEIARDELALAAPDADAPAKPAPSEPAPSEPAPSEPAPSEPAPGEPAPDDASILVGGTVDTASLDKAAGETVGRHVYGNFQGSVPKGDMITVNAQKLPWREIASATSSSALYQDIVRWADALKARGGSVEVAFGHEPEVSSKVSLGTAEEYKQAYRKVVDIFNARGATNVQWVLQMTDWSYRTATTARDHVAQWYPGDAYVDIVGASVYNRHTCAGGRGKDVPLATSASGLVKFAKAHDKKASLPEFAANKTVQRADWLRDGYAFMTSSDVFVSAYYSNKPATSTAPDACSWSLSTDAEKAAYAEMVHGG